MHDAVERAITMMRANYYEPLTLRDVANAALVSPFHFSRLFHATVGIPPGRYLTAVRLFEAKRLLLTTLMNVADVVTTVGYSSVGTFTTRFTRAVGVSPTQYRDPEISGLLAATALPDLDSPASPGGHQVPMPRQGGSGSIVGTLAIPAQADPAEITIGLIDDLIPQSTPVHTTLVEGPMETSLVVGALPTRCVAVAMYGRNPRASRCAMKFAGGRSHLIAVDPGQHLRVDVRLRGRSPGRPVAAVTGW
ncbi:helix-turn-helix transcriptional regulator [Actinosynnema sp. NPDC050801]|jgi:AraC-like DNA-binding protein|uniref:helix-turn-helix transcriptional regulator n=1 Tax=unclassified Actinosynnema TaxID=2637065 RepID=UPI0033D5A359